MTTAKRVVVEAGYVTGQYGTIFDGFVFQAIRGKENGTDYYLKFVCLDSSRYLDEAVVNLSLTNYATMRQVVYNCTKATVQPLFRVHRIIFRKKIYAILVHADSLSLRMFCQ